MAPQTIIFIGRSGCGKGTQSRLLENYLKEKDESERSILYFETGPQFRDLITGKSYTSKLSKEIYDRADRQPDFLAIWTWSHLFVEKLTGEEHLIIDGTPRSLNEANALDTALEFYKRPANIVYLNVGRKKSVERLLARGRMDDASVAKINKRLDWFDRDVLPAVEHYRNHSVHNFIEVNGEQDLEAVHKEIISKLKTV